MLPLLCLATLHQLQSPITLKVDSKPATVESRMAFHHVPGCSVIEIRNFMVVRKLNFGRTAAFRPAQVTDDTLFPLGQLSQPIAHAMVLKAVENRTLDLDSPVRTKLKRYTPPKWGTELTLRHLLTGRGGYTMPKYMGFNPPETAPDLIAELQAEPVASDPGTKWHRSPVNVTVMQVLLEDVTGKKVQDLLPGVFGKGSAQYSANPPDRDFVRNVKGHDELGFPVPLGANTYPELAATGLWSTSGQFARFLIQLMKCQTGRATSPLRPETAALMFAPIETEDEDGKVSRNEAAAFGSMTMGDKKLMLRGGANEGYYCQTWFMPEQGNAVIVFTNRDLAWRFANEVRDAVVGGW
ncbi:MAG: beta-lactamase family protein [Armatimonadetes bacterium]|nr:beta-lactamase family protein [Armatimonadota bacterium]